MIKAVVFDIGHTLVHYKNPLNWKSLYEPALNNVAQQCNYQLTDKNYTDAIFILCEYNTRINPQEKKFHQTTFGVGFLMRGTKN